VPVESPADRCRFCLIQEACSVVGDAPVDDDVAAESLTSSIECPAEADVANDSNESSANGIQDARVHNC
jgi:hypothetical protein